MVKVVEAQLMADVQINEYRADQADRKAEQVDGRKQLLPTEVPQKKEQVISDHRVNFERAVAKAIPPKLRGLCA